MKLRLYAGKESEYSPRTCSVGRPARGTLAPPYNFTCGVDERDMQVWQRSSDLSDFLT